MIIFTLLALFIALLAVILALQNTLTVTVAFLFWEFNGSLALVLLLALVLGVLVSFLAYLPSLIRGNLLRRSLRKRVSELETSLTAHQGRLAETEQKLQALLASAAAPAPAPTPATVPSPESSPQAPDQPASPAE